MKVVQSLTLIAVLLLWPRVAVGQSDEATLAMREDVVKHLTDAIEYEVESKQLPAFSMAIVEGDQTIWSDGFGFQDANKKIPATAETIYRVGSVSKLLTDISIMKLVEAGELNLDEPATTYLPDFICPLFCSRARRKSAVYKHK